MLQKIIIDNNVIVCSGRSGSTLFREQSDYWEMLPNVLDFEKECQSIDNLTFHCLIRHPFDRFLSGLFFEWRGHIFPHIDPEMKPINFDLSYSFDRFIQDIQDKWIILDDFHTGNWLRFLNTDFLEKATVWKFDDIDNLANHVKIIPSIVNENYYLPCSYRELYSRLNENSKRYINSYLFKEIIRYEVIIKNYYKKEK